MLTLTAGTSAGQGPQIVVKQQAYPGLPAPSFPSADEPMTIVVNGLEPHAVVTLTLRAEDHKGVAWQSWAEFEADGQGQVDVTHEAPIVGTYAGVWGMGLLSTMECKCFSNDFVQFAWPSKGDLFELTASGDQTYVRTTFPRELGGPNMCTKSFSTSSAPDIESTFYYQPGPNQGCLPFDHPVTNGRRAAILVIGGAGQSVQPDLARALAARGYPSLAIAYYGGQGLPGSFKRINLLSFAEALQWLKDEVGPRRVIVLGYSRGSEAALLLGTIYPKLVGAVVATSPSSLANGCHCEGDTATPTWRLGNQDIPTSPKWNFPGDIPKPNDPGRIHVDLIRGPIFLVCGRLDEIWPSCPYAEMIRDELKKAGKPPPMLYEMPGASHIIGTLVPFSPHENELLAPVLPIQTAQAGTANDHAREAVWPKLLLFLQQITNA